MAKDTRKDSNLITWWPTRQDPTIRQLKWQGFLILLLLLHKHSLLCFLETETQGNIRELCKRASFQGRSIRSSEDSPTSPARYVSAALNKKWHAEWHIEALLNPGVPFSSLRTHHWINLTYVWPSFSFKPVLLNACILILRKLDGYVWYPWQPSLK